MPIKRNRTQQFQQGGNAPTEEEIKAHGLIEQDGKYYRSKKVPTKVDSLSVHDSNFTKGRARFKYDEAIARAEEAGDKALVRRLGKIKENMSESAISLSREGENVDYTWDNQDMRDKRFSGVIDEDKKGFMGGKKALGISGAEYEEALQYMLQNDLLDYDQVDSEDTVADTDQGEWQREENNENTNPDNDDTGNEPTPTPSGEDTKVVNPPAPTPTATETETTESEEETETTETETTDTEEEPPATVPTSEAPSGDLLNRASVEHGFGDDYIPDYYKGLNGGSYVKAPNGAFMRYDSYSKKYTPVPLDEEHMANFTQNIQSIDPNTLPVTAKGRLLIQDYLEGDDEARKRYHKRSKEDVEGMDFQGRKEYADLLQSDHDGGWNYWMNRSDYIKDFRQQAGLLTADGKDRFSRTGYRLYGDDDLPTFNTNGKPYLSQHGQQVYDQNGVPVYLEADENGEYKLDARGQYIRTNKDGGKLEEAKFFDGEGNEIEKHFLGGLIGAAAKTVGKGLLKTGVKKLAGAAIGAAGSALSKGGQQQEQAPEQQQVAPVQAPAPTLPAVPQQQQQPALSDEDIERIAIRMRELGVGPVAAKDGAKIPMAQWGIDTRKLVPMDDPNLNKDGSQKLMAITKRKGLNGEDVDIETGQPLPVPGTAPSPGASSTDFNQKGGLDFNQKGNGIKPGEEPGMVNKVANNIDLQAIAKYAFSKPVRGEQVKREIAAAPKMQISAPNTGMTTEQKRLNEQEMANQMGESGSSNPEDIRSVVAKANAVSQYQANVDNQMAQNAIQSEQYAEQQHNKLRQMDAQHDQVVKDTRTQNKMAEVQADMREDLINQQRKGQLASDLLTNASKIGQTNRAMEMQKMQADYQSKMSEYDSAVTMAYNELDKATTPEAQAAARQKIVEATKIRDEQAQALKDQQFYDQQDLANREAAPTSFGSLFNVFKKKHKNGGSITKTVIKENAKNERTKTKAKIASKKLENDAIRHAQKLHLEREKMVRKGNHEFMKMYTSLVTGR